MNSFATKRLYSDEIIKVALPSLLAVILCTVNVFAIMLPDFNEHMLVRKKEMIRELTTTAINTIVYFEEREKQGLLTRREAQSSAISQLRNLRYGPGEKDYFWIHDLSPSMIMHPYRSDLEGQDLAGYTDPEGTRLFTEMVGIVKQHGEGYVPYLWQWKDNPELIAPKLSYVKGFTPWGWIIGTGVYLDDVQSDLAALTRDSIRLSSLILLAVFLLVSFLLRQGIVSTRKRRHAELQLLAHQDQLEELVAQKTRDLGISEKKYRTLFETANDAILIISENRIIDCNNKTTELFRCEINQLLDKQPWDISPRLQYDKLTSKNKGMSLIRKALSGEPQFFEWHHLRCDGVTFDAEVSLSSLKLNDDLILQAVIRDISVRKIMEEELSKVQKLESLGVLAGGIAHDFNNLMTITMGNISLIRRRKLTDAQIVNKLLFAEEACSKAKDLTKQLLVFAKGGAPVKQALNISQLIKDGCRFYLKTSNVRSHLDLSGELPLINADKTQIMQIIQNLILNSVQSMPEGGLVSIKAQRHTVALNDPLPLEPGQYVNVKFTDQGKGIPQENINRIFDPYFTTNQDGSGIGLATVFTIIRKHDGHIMVDSTPGQGTTFSFFLPVATKDQGPDKRSSKRKIISGQGKILLMDDDPNIRDTGAEMLAYLGYRVSLAADGHETLVTYKNAMSEEKPFDLVILDLTISEGMGGRDTIIKLLQLDPGVKAVVSSGYADDPIMADCLAFGFAGVVPKPYNIEEMSGIIHNVLHADKQKIMLRS